MPNPPAMPRVTDLLWPTLQAMRDLGGTGTNDEIATRATEIGEFSEDQQAVLQGDGPLTQLDYRLQWARTYLKGMGALENVARAVWALTPRGRDMSESDIPDALREYRQRLEEERRQRQEAAPDLDHEGAPLIPDDGESRWRDALLERLLRLDPDAFERLASRLLREAGFVRTQVTGRSGDGGIDGLGIYRLSLVSFQVFFQCKRYRGSVSSSAVRDFRGAMAGRGDKGLLITTGTFTPDAKLEASRDGAPPIDLIDGDRLCDLLAEHRIGLMVTTRTINEVTIDPDYWNNL